MQKINCCNGCVPPKRNGYCHTYCKEYIEEKAAYEKKKAINDQQKAVHIGLIDQNMKGVIRAQKERRKLKRR